MMSVMGSFLHLNPKERQEIVENIVKKLAPELEKFVKKTVGNFAITEKDVAQRAMECLEEQVKIYIRPRWYMRLFFK
jgi:catalase